MKQLQFAIALLGVLVCKSEGTIHGGKYTVKDDPTDGKRKAELGVFGYSHAGVCEVTVRNLNDKMDSSQLIYPNDSNEGFTFFLVKIETLGSDYTLSPEMACSNATTKTLKRLKMKLVPASKEGSSGSGSDEVKQAPAVYSGKVTFTKSADPGFWKLLMFKCQTDTDSSSNMNLEVRVSEYNKVGTARNYLSYGDEILPLAFMFFAIVFFGLLVKWGHWMSNNKDHLHKIHFLMALALFLKSGTLFFETFRYKHYQEEGNMSSFYDYMYYTFLALKGTLLFAVIALIGSGWSFLKPYLHPRDKKILLVVIPLQLFINILWIVVDHLRDGDSEWDKWQNFLSVLDMACCLIVMVPILWSVKQIRNAQSSDGKVARNLARMKQFRTLYLAIVIYIYFKTIICGMVLTEQVKYDNTWIPPVLTELATLVCFVFVGLKFRPMKENPYTHLEEEDFQEAGEALDMELADLDNNRKNFDDSNQPMDIAVTSTTEQRKGDESKSVSAVRKQPEADF
eukprot:TRINITY_DN8634_c3_g1_i1.p1 TRINITY_DN8634_c3_g1~~TRINITY_DN8634_c3_g1_i1.p1  ORF type:complete len:509 (+),score=106.55 TRINITY_DN8634_c3_g1_i1:57-1583(+)